MGCWPVAHVKNLRDLAAEDERHHEDRLRPFAPAQGTEGIVVGQLAARRSEVGRVERKLSTRERKYDDVAYSNGVLASVTAGNKDQEMAVKKYVIELMGQSTKYNGPVNRSQLARREALSERHRKPIA